MILKHRLPITRGNKTVGQFLDAYFKEYIFALKTALHRTDDCALRKECYDLLSKSISIIEELCNDILKVFAYYDNANMTLLYEHFSTMMDKIEPFLFVKDIGKIGNDSFKSYYRIRAGKEQFSRLDMFHISMDNRHLIKSFRYSIPGYPCLYLSTGLELCWFECGMPKEFCYSAFNLALSDTERVQFIDFSITPVDLVSSMSISYLNHPEDSDLIDAFIVKYLASFPLRVACSIEAINRNVAFVEEYVFPQHLLLWVRETESFDGIAYRTSSAIEEARKWNYINVVMPAREVENGYCRRLNKLFTITEPVKVEIRNIIKNHDNQIEKVRKFVVNLEQKYYHGYSLYPYREILSLCKTFLQLCNLLTTDNYVNAEAIYQAMDTLNLLSYLIVDNKESIQIKSLDEGKRIFFGLDESILIQEFNVTMDDFAENVKPALFEFWSYVVRIGGDAPVDYHSYQHAM